MTIYLPDELKRSVERAAAVSGRSEAEVTRQAIAIGMASLGQRRPRGGLFPSDVPSLAEQTVELLQGFGTL